MKYEYKEEKTRWYKYGLGKEFETKEKAILILENDINKKMTEFYLNGLYRLIESQDIEDDEEGVRKVIRFKYPISILE